MAKNRGRRRSEGGSGGSSEGGQGSDGSSNGIDIREHNDDTLSNMFRDGYAESEVETLRNALSDNNYYINGYNDREVSLQLLDTGNNDSMNINLDRTALRSLIFSSEDNSPGLKEMLKSINDNPEFRQNADSLDVFSQFSDSNRALEHINNGEEVGRDRNNPFYNQYYINVTSFESESTQTFNEKMNDLFTS